MNIHVVSGRTAVSAKVEELEYEELRKVLEEAHLLIDGNVNKYIMAYMDLDDAVLILLKILPKTKKNKELVCNNTLQNILNKINKPYQKLSIEAETIMKMCKYCY